VVAVVAIVFAVGAPSLVQVIQKGPMRQAVSDVMEALGQARAQSILRGVGVEFIMTGEGEVRVGLATDRRRRLERDRVASVEEGAIVGGREIFTARLGEDIAITLLEVNFRSQMNTSEARVRFFPNGTSDDFTVVLESGREMRRIWLDPITARADLEQLR
jgi:Tfp pilus assembly protein FimT